MKGRIISTTDKWITIKWDNGEFLNYDYDNFIVLDESLINGLTFMYNNDEINKWKNYFKEQNNALHSTKC